MAPIRKRPNARARIAAKSADPRGKYAPVSSNTTSTAAAAERPSSGDALSNLKDDYFGFDSVSGFRISKKDKRTIKHGNLLNKVREAGIGKNSGKKRRRPETKLKTNIGELGDALPDISEDEEAAGAEDVWEGVSEDGESVGTAMEVRRRGRRRRRRIRKADGDGKMVMKSLKHRPGAMKKRKVLEEGERERFGRNLAQLVQAEGAKEAAGGGQGCGEEMHTQKWAALRAFIGSTMQKDKAFAAM